MQQADGKILARTGTEAESAVPALHHPNWSGNPGLGTPSHTGGNSSQESGLNPVLYGHAGMAGPAASSQSSAPHGPYHGAPYGVPAGGNYGGPNYVGSYAGSQYGSPTPHAASHPGGSQVGGYGGAAYGAASYAGSEYRQDSATPQPYPSALGGEGTGMRDAPPMHGSIVDSSAMGSTQPGDVGYSGVPQPVAVGTGSAAVPLAPVKSADEESGSMLGGPPMISGGAAPVPPRLDADGRVISAPPTAEGAARSEAPSSVSAPKVGEPHTSNITGDALPQPERGADLLALGNTTDAQQGPFTAAAAARGSGVYAPAGASTAVSTSAKAASTAPAKEAVREPRGAQDRLATQVFDKTVAPDMDIADFTHEKVVDMLEDVHSDKALFRDKCAPPLPAPPHANRCPRSHSDSCPTCVCRPKRTPPSSWHRTDGCHDGRRACCRRTHAAAAVLCLYSACAGFRVPTRRRSCAGMSSWARCTSDSAEPASCSLLPPSTPMPPETARSRSSSTSSAQPLTALPVRPGCYASSACMCARCGRPRGTCLDRSGADAAIVRSAWISTVS